MPYDSSKLTKKEKARIKKLKAEIIKIGKTRDRLRWKRSALESKISKILEPYSRPYTKEECERMQHAFNDSMNKLCEEMPKVLDQPSRMSILFNESKLPE